jgi:hypothetical protein
MKKSIVLLVFTMLSVRVGEGLYYYGQSTNEKKNIEYGVTSPCDMSYRIALKKLSKKFNEKDYFKPEEKEKVIANAIEQGQGDSILWGPNRKRNKVYLTKRESYSEISLVDLAVYLHKHYKKDGKRWALNIFRGILGLKGQHKNIPGWWWSARTYRMILNNFHEEILLKIPKELREELLKNVLFFLGRAKKRDFRTRQKPMVDQEGRKLRSLQDIVNELRNLKGFEGLPMYGKL